VDLPPDGRVVQDVVRNQPVMVAVLVDAWTDDDRAVSGRGSE